MRNLRRENTIGQNPKQKLFNLATGRNTALPVRIVTAVLMLACIVATICAYSRLCGDGTSVVTLFSYALNLCGMIVVFVLCLAFVLDTSPADLSARIFFILFTGVFFGAFNDAMNVLCAGIPEVVVLNKITLFLCFLASPVTCFSFCCYQYALLEKPNRKIKIYLVLMAILGAADVLFFIGNLFFGYVYTIGADGVCIDGKLSNAYLIYPVLSMISSMFVSRHVLGFQQKKTGTLLLVCIVSLGIGVAVANMKYFITYFIFSVIILLIYGSIQANRGKEIAKKNEMIAHQAMDLVKQEQQIMISQINPHFVYNTLSTIECLCETDPHLAVKTVQNFANYLRTNVDTLTKVETVKFERELEHVGHYVAIEILRFPQIEVEYDIRDRDFLIPNLTIQPMVENAIRYGVRMRDQGKIKISSYYQDMTHYVEIEDNGCGFDVSAPKKQDGRGHIGIENVRSRLEKMVNGNLCIISKIGVGTKVIISIPAQKESD